MNPGDKVIIDYQNETDWRKAKMVTSSEELKEALQSADAWCKPAGTVFKFDGDMVQVDDGEKFKYADYDIYKYFEFGEMKPLIMCMCSYWIRGVDRPIIGDDIPPNSNFHYTSVKSE